VVGENLAGHPLDVLDVGEVAAVDVGAATGGDDLVAGLLQLLDRAGDEQDGGPGVGDLDRSRSWRR